MRRTISPGLAVLTLAAVGLSPATAAASAQQLHIAPALGFGWSSGNAGGVGGVLALHGGYGINDTFRLYSNLEYGLGAGVSDAATPRHSGALSVGVAYALDVLSLVPWAGLGVQGNLIGTPASLFLVPAIEARGGLDYLPTRQWGLTFQLAYGFAVANRDAVGDLFSTTLGVRFTADL